MNNDYRIRWTDGNDMEFEMFHAITENFYNQLVGGPQNRQSFVSGNLSKDVKYAIIVYSKEDVPVACSGLKEHGNGDVEIKRVWVQPPFRGHHIATFIIRELESFAHEHGYRRTVLMTRVRMDYAIKLYEGLGYKRIENYPPYQHMDDAVCYAKELL
jgi:putative acetyltransferase